MRRAAGFTTLSWLDWDTLLAGLLPTGVGEAPGPSRVVGGGPSPGLLRQNAAAGAESRHALLSLLVEGEAPDEDDWLEAGFSGGEARWLTTLGHLSKEPDRALERLDEAELATPAELYLREHLRLSRRTHAVNLELNVFAAKRRLSLGLARFGEHPALFYARALASALIGFNHAAIDDLARAVYFSRQAPFYLRAVTQTPYIAEARPALAQQCHRVLDPMGKVG